MFRYPTGQRFKAKAKGRKTIKRPQEMNGLEREYALYLEGLKRSGEVLDYSYEPLKLRLADKTFYSPDFMVLRPDETLELHEVKATWRSKRVDDPSVIVETPHIEAAASVKIKLAAEMHPFKFLLVYKLKGIGWTSKEY